MHDISPVQIYLRAGWSLGNVQDRYIFGGAGGDELVGRAVCGLPILEREFCILPPHFSGETLARISAAGWNNILESYDSYPQCFKRTVPYLLASLVYHFEYLRGKLSNSHPLWKQRLFTQKLIIEENNIFLTDFLKKNVVTGYGYCKLTNMRSTGVPTSIAMAQEIRMLQEKVDKMTETHTSSLLNFQEATIKSIQSIPEAVKNTIMENFEIDGVAPINVSDVQNIVSQSSKVLLEQMKELINQISSREANNINNINRTQQINTTYDVGPTYFDWGGKLFRLVPENFQFSSTDVKSSWDVWQHGQGVQWKGKACRTYPLKRLLDKRIQTRHR
jgi:hypothetical protein